MEAKSKLFGRRNLIIHNRFLFPKKNRLLAPGDYQQVFKRGMKHYGSVLTLVGCANGFSHARLGLAIAKKQVPLSVHRNRVRRVIRESFRHYQFLLPGMDIVVFAKKELSGLSNAFLQEDLNRQWQKLMASLSKSS